MPCERFGSEQDDAGERRLPLDEGGDRHVSDILGPHAETWVHAHPRCIAYLSLQAVVDGQDSWAAVTEIVDGFREEDCLVDEYFPDYAGVERPGPLKRCREMLRIQRALIGRVDRYDAIYVRAHPFAWLASRAARKAGIPVIQECNGPYEDMFIAWPPTRIARPLIENLERAQYRCATAVISVAQGLTRWLVQETGNTNIFTSGNGANTRIFTPYVPRREGLPDRFAVFFGQFPAWQGIPTLLEAVRMSEWPAELPLVFVGDGALRPEIERAAAEMPDRVVYLGRLPYARVAHVVAHAELSLVPMLAPEREEKFSPLKLYESMACGVPVVASDTLGISEIVTRHDCGLLFEPGDAKGLLAAVRRLLDDPKAAKEMGSRGLQAARELYSWEARARQRLKIVEWAIEGGDGIPEGLSDPTVRADRASLAARG